MMNVNKYGPTEQIARRLERAYHTAGGDGSERAVAEAMTAAGLTGVREGAAARLYADLCNHREPIQQLWRDVVQLAVMRGDIPPQKFDRDGHIALRGSDAEVIGEEG